MSQIYDDLDELPARPRKSIPAADRELLELAARAIGAVRVEDVDGEEWLILHFADGTETHGWNPLLFSGDTFELGVELRLFEEHPKFLWHLAEEQNLTTNPVAAAQRAAVRAAAEIGKQRA